MYSTKKGYGDVEYSIKLLNQYPDHFSQHAIVDIDIENTKKESRYIEY